MGERGENNILCQKGSTCSVLGIQRGCYLCYLSSVWRLLEKMWAKDSHDSWHLRLDRPKLPDAQIHTSTQDWWLSREVNEKSVACLLFVGWRGLDDSLSWSFFMRWFTNGLKRSIKIPLRCVIIFDPVMATVDAVDSRNIKEQLRWTGLLAFDM